MLYHDWGECTVRPECLLVRGNSSNGPRRAAWFERSEAGKEIHIEDDVWIGGSAIILAGVRIGRGSTVGAGSVVTEVGASIQCDSETWANRCRMFPLFTLSLVTRPELSDESILRWI